MSSQQKTRTIEEIKQKISVLREEDEKLNDESRELAEKRNKLNDQFKNLRLEILALRSNRDKLNEKVKELKQQREDAEMRIGAIVKGSNELRQRIKILNDKKPTKTREVLQKELDDIEWKIQTTPLSLQEEKKLIEKVRQIESQLNTYKKLAQLNLELGNLQAELKTLETRVDGCYEELAATVEKSREAHAKMLQKIDESRRVKADADRLHTLYLEVREKTKHLRKEIAEMSSQMRNLEKEIREEVAKEKMRAEEVLRGKLEEEVRAKLKRGEKLSWEEFQLLKEEQTETQD